jgi:enamine deaminase RidA (YjgF/YER057c/UK114 family)/uncharacterized protein YdiU (UPF0061 family)
MAAKARYPRFRRIDGTHPWKRRVAGGFVDYHARRRRDGEVAFFNFALAKEMGLISASHPERLNPALSRAILDTFGLQILNEWDYLHRTRVPARDRLPNTYMATRYLQLQHPGRRGTTSGDGRSVWNGTITHGGVTWDMSSCGVGVTRLCPATAKQGRFFRTGSRTASYGCGTAALGEGISAALLSETFHRNGIATERVLAVIALSNGYAINVRAGRNLLRPSHFFAPLKQNDLGRLRAAIDVFAERQIQNGDWPKLSPGAARHRHLAEAAAVSFARAAATFESEYVFCWLDWDGDNVLADGGIIDYGSVRQFGLYHREYRFDDSDRWSTTIPEQRTKARAIVQGFAQIRAFLLEGVKRPLGEFAHDPALARFDREFADTKQRLLLRKLGLRPATGALLARSSARELERCVSELGFVGGMLSADSYYLLGHERFDPIYATAQRLRVPITVHAGDVYNQTRQCLTTIIAALAEAGGGLESVVRTRVMLTDIAGWHDAARAHGEVFAAIRPACTFVAVTRFVDPEWLVEIEADAYVI